MLISHTCLHQLRCHIKKKEYYYLTKNFKNLEILIDFCYQLTFHTLVLIIMASFSDKSSKIAQSINMKYEQIYNYGGAYYGSLAFFVKNLFCQMVKKCPHLSFFKTLGRESNNFVNLAFTRPWFEGGTCKHLSSG